MSTMMEDSDDIIKPEMVSQSILDHTESKRMKSSNSSSDTNTISYSSFQLPPNSRTKFNPVEIFNFLIQHLNLSTYLPTSTLLVLQRVSLPFFNLITPLFYKSLIIDLKDPRNPASSISPFKFYPNPRPPLSRFKTLAFSYTRSIEFTGSHGYECAIFEEELSLPYLESVRITLPSGKFRSWCGKQPTGSSYSVSTTAAAKSTSCWRTKDELQCGLLRHLRTRIIIVEVEKFSRIDLFARRDFFEHEEVILRIGRVGEDAFLDGEDKWPMLFKDENMGDAEKERASHGEAPNENSSLSPSAPNVYSHLSPNLRQRQIEWIKSLTLTPSLTPTNTPPNLTIIFLSPPNTRISKPLSSDDLRTDEQRVNHHLLALSMILSSNLFVGSIKLVNVGVLMFYKYGIRRDKSDMMKMQEEVKDILSGYIKTILDVKNNDNDNDNFVEINERPITVMNIMDKVDFILLDDYLNEERQRKDQVKIKAKSGEKGKRLLY